MSARIGIIVGNPADPRGGDDDVQLHAAAGAAAVGLPLRPTKLLIFGNASGGTPLMQADQTMGIDLPAKAFVYEDAAGKVWLAYNDPAWLTSRHGLGHEVEPTVKTMRAALSALAIAVTSP